MRPLFRCPVSKHKSRSLSSFQAGWVFNVSNCFLTQKFQTSNSETRCLYQKILTLWQLINGYSCSFHKSICMGEAVSISKHPNVNHLDVRNTSHSVKRFPRRLFSQFIGLYPILLYAYPGFGAPMMDMQEPDKVRYVLHL